MNKVEDFALSIQLDESRAANIADAVNRASLAATGCLESSHPLVALWTAYRLLSFAKRQARGFGYSSQELAQFEATMIVFEQDGFFEEREPAQNDSAS